MAGSNSPRHPNGSIGYNRIQTTLQVEENNINNATNSVESNISSEFRQFFSDFQEQFDSTFQGVSWDRIFMTVFLTITIWLIVFTLFPYLNSQFIADQKFQHEFTLNSLTISDFQVSSAQVTGKCDVTLNVRNVGDRSIYHETSVLSIFMDHELLWVTRTRDFFLDIGNSIMFSVSMNKTSISVPASFVPTAMVESREMHKPLRFKVKYDGMLREGMAAWYEERSHVYFICGWVEMQFINETTLQGGPATCSLENY